MIVFNNVSKVYYSQLSTFRKSALIKLFSNKNREGTILADGEYFALENLSLQINKGEKVLLLSPGTMEVQTIAKIICGLTRPSSGYVQINGTSRLASAKVSGQISYIKLKTFLNILLLSLTHKNINTWKSTHQVLQDCNASMYENEVLFNIPDEILNKIAYYSSILIDSDIYILPPAVQSQDKTFTDACNARLGQIYSSKTVLHIRNSVSDIPKDVSNSFLVYNGSLLLQGTLESAIELFTTLPKPEHPGFAIADDPEDDDDDNSISTTTGSAYISSTNDALKTIQIPLPDKNNGCTILDYSQFYNAIDTPALRTMLKQSISNFSLQSFRRNDMVKIFGPFLENDPIFELFLWIPFIRWVLDTYPNSNLSKICVISQGMKTEIYSDLGIKNIDISELFSKDTLRLYNNELSYSRGNQFNNKSINDTLMHYLRLNHFQGIHNFKHHQIHPDFLRPLFEMMASNILPASLLLAITSYRKIKVTKKLNDKQNDTNMNQSIIVQPCRHTSYSETISNIFEEIIAYTSSITGNIKIICDCGQCSNIYKELIHKNNIHLIDLKKESVPQYHVSAQCSLFIGTESYYAYLAPNYGTKTLILIRSASDYSFLKSLLNCQGLSYLKDNMTVLSNLQKSRNDIIEVINKYIPAPKDKTDNNIKEQPKRNITTKPKIDTTQSQGNATKQSPSARTRTKTLLNSSDMMKVLELPTYYRIAAAQIERFIMSCNKPGTDIVFYSHPNSVPEFELIIWIPFIQWIKNTLTNITGNTYCAVTDSRQLWYRNTQCSILNITNENDYKLIHNQNETRVTNKRTLPHNLTNCLVINSDILCNFIKLIQNQTLLNEFLKTHSIYEPFDPIPTTAMSLPKRYILTDIQFNTYFQENSYNIKWLNNLIDEVPTDMEIIDISDNVMICPKRKIITPDELKTTTNEKSSIFEALLFGASAVVSTLSDNSWLTPFYGNKSINCISSDELEINKIYKYITQTSKLEFYNKNFYTYKVDKNILADKIIAQLTSI